MSKSTMRTGSWGWAALVAAALLAVAIPRASFAWECSKPTSVRGITAYNFQVDFNYGGVRATYRGYFSWNDASSFDYSVGIKDRMADGYPPYLFHKYYVRGRSDSLIGPQLYNRLSASGGWECWDNEIPSSSSPIYKVELWASVGNAPGIPEVKLTEFWNPLTSPF